MCRFITIPPKKGVFLYISGLCACDCNDNIMIRDITDRLDLLICEQTENDPKVRTQR